MPLPLSTTSAALQHQGERGNHPQDPVHLHVGNTVKIPPRVTEVFSHGRNKHCFVAILSQNGHGVLLLLFLLNGVIILKNNYC